MSLEYTSWEEKKQAVREIPELGRFVINGLRKLPEVGKAVGVLTIALLSDGRSVIPVERQAQVIPSVESEFEIPSLEELDPPSEPDA